MAAKTSRQAPRPTPSRRPSAFLLAGITVSTPHVRAHAYEAAGSSGIRGGAWQTASGGPNQVLLSALDTLRQRARDAARQNGYANRILDHQTANVIGSGIRPITRFPDLQRLWDDWCLESDPAGKTDFYGQQALAVRSALEGGDCFARLRARKPDDLATVPLQVQLLEAEHVPAVKTERAENGNAVVGGVERDGIGRAVAYHMYRAHPQDLATLTAAGADAFVTTRVPATDVCHVMFPRRPGEERGEPWLARALLPLHDLREYDDAELKRKQTSALLNGIIRRPTTPDAGDVPLPTADGDGVAVGALVPGGLQVLPDGYDISFLEPVDVGGNYDAYMRRLLGGIAVSCGMTYEQLTSDWTGMNDRTYRASMLEYGRLVEQLQRVVIHQLCRPVWRRFVQLARLSGAWAPPDGVSERDIYRCEWMPPARGHIHPVQEVEAARAAVEGGFWSRRRAVAELGAEVSAIDAENAADKARAEALGLSYASYAPNAGRMADGGPVAAAILADATAQAGADLATAEAAEADTVSGQDDAIGLEPVGTAEG